MHHGYREWPIHGGLWLSVGMPADESCYYTHQFFLSMLEAPQKGGPLTSPPRALAATLVAVVTILLTTPSKTAEPAALKTIVVLPFEIEDTSGEVGPADRHDAMLGRLTAFVRNEIASGQFYRVEPENLTDEAVKAVNAGTFLRGCHGCEIDIAKRLGASHVLVGWIYKVSTLILALHIEVKEVTTGKTIYARVFDFRGDNEQAYAHAARAVVRSLTEAEGR
jgi:hypothetical protein